MIDSLSFIEHSSQEFVWLNIITEVLHKLCVLHYLGYSILEVPPLQDMTVACLIFSNLVCINFLVLRSWIKSYSDRYMVFTWDHLWLILSDNFTLRVAGMLAGGQGWCAALLGNDLVHFPYSSEYYSSSWLSRLILWDCWIEVYSINDLYLFKTTWCIKTEEGVLYCFTDNVNCYQSV